MFAIPVACAASPEEAETGTEAPEKAATEKRGETIPAAPIIPAPAKKAAEPEATPETPGAGELAALKKDYDDAMAAYFKPYREARAKGETYKLDATKHPRRTYGTRFSDLAKQYAGTDVALDAWIMAMSAGGDRDAIAGIILRDHMESARLMSAVGMLRYLKEGDAMLGRIAEESPHREVRGFAMLIRGEALLRKGAPEAETVLEQAQRDYGDVEIYGGRFTIASKAEGNLFEARSLAIGNVAPDIEGEDVHGKPFKLSDYRGKVVLLDFWGDW